MIYTIKEIKDVVAVIEATDFFEAMVSKLKHLDVENEVVIFEEGDIKFTLKRDNPFTDSTVAPINPELLKPVDSIEVLWGIHPIGNFSLTAEDYDPSSRELVNLTIANDVKNSLKANFFWKWYGKTVMPMLSSGAPTATIVDMVRPRLNDFGYDFNYLFDGKTLQMTTFKMEPFEMVYSLQVTNTMEKDIEKYPRGYFNTMIHDVIKDIFYNEGDGMNSSFDPTIPES